MGDPNTTLDEIKRLIAQAEDHSEKNFRITLEKLIKEAGKDGERLLAQYIGSDDIEADIRINLIRISGYLQSVALLVPLKKIIDTDPHIHLKKEAVISVAKYNDRRALNILNNSLKEIRNPLLLQTINSEISKVKQNNPILGLLPRFLEGNKHPKNFRITVDILKRILTPPNVPLFIPYLDCGSDILETGTFEILCAKGTLSIKKSMLQFYKRRFSRIPCLDQPECDELYFLTYAIKEYYLRFPEVIDEELKDLQFQFLTIKDIRVKDVMITIICKSEAQEAISFIEGIYDREPELRERIITELAGNDQACGFLFEKYDSEETFKEEIINSLLRTQSGLKYYYDTFFERNLDEQELIVRNFPFINNPYFVHFSRMILESQRYPLKILLLGKIRENHEFSVRDILFDPEREKEFLYMEKEYYQTILQLFPVSAVKKILNIFLEKDLTVTKAKKNLQMMDAIVSQEMALNLDQGNLTQLIGKILKANNKELNHLFLATLRKVKTLSPKTYHDLRDLADTFVFKLGSKINDNIRTEARRFKKNLLDMANDLRKIQEGEKLLETIQNKVLTDLSPVENLLNNYPITVALQLRNIIAFLSQHFCQASEKALETWVRFFKNYPRIAYFLKNDIGMMTEKVSGSIQGELTKIYDTLPCTRLIMCFHDKSATGYIRDQLMEYLGETEIIITDYPEFESGDILLCDAEALKNLSLKSDLPQANILLFLEEAGAFAEFKTYKPRSYIKPFSFYKLITDVLQELYHFPLS